MAAKIDLTISSFNTSDLHKELMRSKIAKLGRLNLVILITVTSLMLAVVLDMLIAYLLNHEFKYSEDLVRATIIPLLIAPFISWSFMGLLIKLDKLEKEMNVQATHDELTGLLNRRAFLQSCESIHNLAIRNKQSYCLLVIDLDYFKEINDKYGHPCGDLTLATLGQLLFSISRKSDVIARLGGEEFGFLLPDTNKKQAMEYAQKVHDNINALEVNYDNKLIKITVSIGISMNAANEDLFLEDIYKQADKALYDAKHNGRNQFVFYT